MLLRKTSQRKRQLAKPPQTTRLKQTQRKKTNKAPRNEFLFFLFLARFPFSSGLRAKRAE